ncbi:sensor histidine kinase [Bradyrhizobium sp. CCBAU 45384]|uniref:sensor histidine kinase n=1 Tax=Bradyrhizobium sp. CCBAU 45384 TaxID=858428 RepID=UPI0023064CD7|nr:sensor histidine kinase [Bradyrhizobium sp. CCBAU 45384]MDA9410785.1 histidine kinase [Bradyrhizobium sp. CCBAU 45384]
MLPLIVFAVGIAFYNYKQDRSDATRRVLENVRSMRLVLDSEVQRMTGGLQVLALTDSLRNDDFVNFRSIALGFLEQYGKSGLVLISDGKGRILFSSTTEDTASLPPRGNMAIVERLFAIKAPQYSDLFNGVYNHRQVLTVEVPVFRDGEVVYDLCFSPPIGIFQTLVEKQRPNTEWTVSLLDTTGTVFARVPNPGETFGKRAAPSLYAEMFRSDEAALSSVSLDGIALASAYTRSHLTGWTVAAGVPESSLIAPLWRNIAITSLIGGVLLLIGLTFAVRMATTIARGEMLHNLLVEELNHRVKNTLALMQAIAVQTFRSASRDERTKFEGRLSALAEAHNLLSQEKWAGSELRDVIARALQPFLLANPDRIRMSGPAVPLSPRLAVVLSMIVHEIATNAAKYGALSNETGRVTLDWEVIADIPKPRLRLIWTETGGPPVTEPVRRGFGSRLIERSARDQLGGEATMDFLPRGVVCTVTCVLDETR